MVFSGGYQLNHVFLYLAILSEVIATSLLTASEGFTKPILALSSLLCYAAAFYCLAQALRALPVGIAYGIWSGVGIVFISLIGVVWFRQTLDIPAVIGLIFIVVGVLIINLFSETVIR
jgi:small multidrug resistance pump